MITGRARIIHERNSAKPLGVRAACRRPASEGWSKLQHSEGAFGTGSSFRSERNA